MADDFNVLDQESGGEDPQAARFGLKIITTPAGAVNNEFSLASGTAVYVLVRSLTAVTITHVGAWCATAAVTDGGDNLMGVYSVAGTRLAVTGEMNFTAAGWVEGALTSPLALSAATSYYLACVTHYTTAPKIAATTSPATFDRVAINGVRPTIYHTSQSDLPSSITPGSLTVNSVEYVFGAR